MHNNLRCGSIARVTDEAAIEDAWAAARAKYEQLENHPGRIARNQWDGLVRVHKVLMANEAELLELIDAFEAGGELTMEVMRNEAGQTDARDQFFDELFRRMHNYLSAVKMLVEHTRNLVRNYPGGPFVEQYRERIADIATRGNGPFLQKLRDYLIHYRIPPFGYTMSLKNGGDTTFIVHLNRDAALKFRDWPALAKNFLENQPESIPLAPLIRKYEGELEELYRWLYDRFHELHASDIRSYNALLIEIQGAEHTPGHQDYRPVTPPPPTS